LRLSLHGFLCLLFACVTVVNLHANDFLFDSIFYIANLVVVLYATRP